MFGVDELTRELALLRLRGEQIIPPLTHQVGRLATSIDNLVATWKDDGGPTFAQLSMHISAIRSTAERIKKASASADAMQRAKDVGKELLDRLSKPAGGE